MYLNEAKIKLLDAGYRIIKENSDVYSDIREILMDDGYSEEMVEELMMKYNAEIEDLLSVDKSAFEIAANIEGYEEISAEDETEEIELGGDRYGDYVDPDEYMEESKSNKQKTDKFVRKAKLAGKKKACKDCDEDEDEELDEGFFANKPGREGVLIKLEDGLYPLLQHNKKANQTFKAFEYVIQNGGKNVSLSEIRELCYNGNNLNCYTKLEECFAVELLTKTQVGNRKFISITPKGMKLYKVTADYLAGKPVKNLVSKEEYKKWYDGDPDVYSKKGSVQESIEDIEGLTRGPRGQQGTDDWSDFKDDFRAQTLILKKTLTPKFVSGLIKDMDFEIDSKDIKDVAVKMLEYVKDTKNPVENLQARIRKFFTK